MDKKELYGEVLPEPQPSKWKHLEDLPDEWKNHDPYLIGVGDSVHMYSCFDYNHLREIYLTSDWHLCHKNIIRYAERPFETTQEMDLAILNRTNGICGEGSVLYECGDLLFGYFKTWKTISTKLKPWKVYAIWGNHDYKNLNYKSKYVDFGTALKNRLVNKSGDICVTEWRWSKRFSIFITNPYDKEVLLRIAVTHEPMDLDELLGMGYDLNLHGHLHTFPDMDRYKGGDRELALKLLETGRYYDVGVDNNNFMPVSLQDILVGKTVGQPPHILDFKIWKQWTRYQERN